MEAPGLWQDQHFAGASWQFLPQDQIFKFFILSWDSENRVQSRFSLLASACGPEALCRVLAAWIAGVEKDEASRGVPAAQIQAVLDGESIIGCNPCRSVMGDAGGLGLGSLP